jgi:hypothetical protein
MPDEPDYSAMARNMRSMSGDENYDYDMDAWRRANPGVQMGPGQHYPDTYKKPNHPTFSDQSMYHGQGGAEGGHWDTNPDGTWTFTPGRTNLENFSADALRDYFQRVEPGNTLNLPASQPGAPQQFMGQDVATAHMPMLESIGNSVRINPQAWERFLREQQPSTNIEDRRTNDPTMFGLERAIRVPQERLMNTILR